jgi:hypothetical protein
LQAQIECAGPQLFHFVSQVHAAKLLGRASQSSAIFDLFFDPELYLQRVFVSKKSDYASEPLRASNNNARSSRQQK